MSWRDDQQRRDEERRRGQDERDQTRRDDLAFIRNLCGCGLGPRSINGVCTSCHARSKAGESLPEAFVADRLEPGWSDPVPDDRYDRPLPAYLDPDTAMDPAERASTIRDAQDRLASASEMDRLWERAVDGCDDVGLQQSRFWMLVNESSAQDALAAREYLRSAGYELARGSTPPRFTEVARRPPPDPTDATDAMGATDVVIGCAGCGGSLTAVGGLCLGCARQAAVAAPVDARLQAAGAQRDAVEDTATEDRRIRAREAGNLCMNLCAPAVIGRLCTGCAAQLRHQEASMERYREAFSASFADTPEIASLWHRASHTRRGEPRGYADARQEFWTLVTADRAPEARFVRHLLQAAGYDQEPGRAPLLRTTTGDHRAGRERADRLLTIDHASPQHPRRDGGAGTRHDAGRATDPANLRFMSGRDNAERGNDFTADDRPVRGWDSFWEVSWAALGRLRRP